MKFSKKIKINFVAVSSLLLAACSSSVEDPLIESEVAPGEVQLCIPISTLTRGEDIDPSDAEKQISSLTVLLYKKTKYITDVESKKPTYYYILKKTSLNEAINKLNGGESYLPIPIRVESSGDYYVYVFANINHTDLVNAEGQRISTNDKVGGWNTIIKSDLDNAQLKTELKTQSDVESSGLPMTCGYKAIRKTPSTSSTLGQVFEDNLVKIESNKVTTVYADLLYTHAKVRYTIYNKSVDELAFEDNPIQIENYTKTLKSFGHIIPGDGVTGPTIESEPGSVSGSFFNVPDDLKNADYKTYDFSASQLGEALDSKPDGGWVYQGFVYIPERLFATDQTLDPDPDKKDASGSLVNPTDALKIKFNFNLSAYSKARVLGGKKTIKGDNDGFSYDDGNEDGHKPKLNGVVRGVFYDVVGLVQSRQIDLQVRVKNWTYHKSVQDLE